MPRNLIIWVLNFLCMGLVCQAHAFECDIQLAKPSPEWVTQFGQNSDASLIHGFAQTAPAQGQTLTGVMQALKTSALSDLALNIRSDVSSNISTELNFDGDKASDKTSIKSAAESNLSIGALSGTQRFVDHENCLIFIRVSIQRSDVPFIFALSTFRTFEADLATLDLSLERIGQLPGIIDAMRQASKAGSVGSQQQFEALKLEINSAISKARNKEIALMAPALDNLTGSPSQKRIFLKKLVSLIDANGEDSSISDGKIKDEANALLTSIDAVMDSELVAVSWSKSPPAIDNALNEYFSAKSAEYWLANLDGDKQALLNAATQYGLSSVLFLDVTSLISRRFGIEEVEITVSLNYHSTLDGALLKDKQLKGKGIGRPIDDKIISSKLLEILDEGV